ncbi:MAG TPA: FAD-dependent oxidoreductase, partial [Dongiaceae bacterium]|nr:FAD-dependent oxidoreductase [Dongiaceae bacterium]
SEWMYVESDDPDEANDAQVDRLLLAGEHTSDDYYGFMNGAAQTGRLAAQWILRDMEEVVRLEGEVVAAAT